METLKRILPALLFIFPLAVFAQHQPTSYDSDGDGVPDSIDKCTLVRGFAEFQGCPYAPLITVNDRDGDGVPDAYDGCPDMFGQKSNRGCPDLALINNTNGMSDGEQTGSPSGAILFTSTSSSQAQQLTDFKDNLLAVLASSGHTFSDIKTGRDEKENDYKTALCLAGADECYIDLTQHFYATYGTYSDLNIAMDKYESLKTNLQRALGETNWSSNETIDNGIKSFEMKRTNITSAFAPRVSAYVEETTDHSYKVFLKVDSK